MTGDLLFERGVEVRLDKYAMTYRVRRNLAGALWLARNAADGVEIEWTILDRWTVRAPRWCVGALAFGMVLAGRLASGGTIEPPAEEAA
jgi:hypothetical protein